MIDQTMNDTILAACRAHTPQFDRMDPDIKKYALQQMRAALAVSVEHLIQENERLKAVINKAKSDMWPCKNDGGFDREVGPIGCILGDKCVCAGIYPTLNAALTRPSPSSPVDPALAEGA